MLALPVINEKKEKPSVFLYMNLNESRMCLISLVSAFLSERPHHRMKSTQIAIKVMILGEVPK
jgi:hypothetical protein